MLTKPINIVEIIILIFTGLLIVQILMLIIVSRFKNVQEASAIRSIIAVVMFVCYCLTILNWNASLFTNEIIVLISYLPLTSMLFMSSRIILGSVSVIDVFIAIVLNVVTILILLNLALRNYSRNMLSNFN